MCVCIFAVVQSLSHVQFFVTPWTAACQASLSFTISWSLLNLISLESTLPSNHLILYHPLLLLPSIFPSIRDFSNESVVCIWWPNYWSFSFSAVLPKNNQGWFPLGLTGLISLLSKGLSRVFSSTQSKGINSLALSFFFIVQFSHPYTTTGKTIALTIWASVDKVIFLLT